MPENGKTKYRIKRVIRFIFRIVMAIFGLLIVLSLLLNIPAVQTYLTGRIGTYLEKKLNTEINVRSVKIALPKTVVIKGIYVEDQNEDTLLYLDALHINVSLFKLMRHQVDVENLTLEGLKGQVFRKLPGNRFNFQFIADAFAQKDSIPESNGTKEGKPWEISARKIVLQNIDARYFDDVVGIDARLNLGELNLKVKTLDIPGLVFKARELILRNMTGDVTMWKVEGKSENAVTASEISDSTVRSQVVAALDRLLMENAALEFRYRDFKQHFAADIGTLDFTKGRVDLNTNQIGVEQLSLQDAGLLASLPVTSNDKLPNDTSKVYATGDSIAVSEILGFFPDWNIAAGNVNFKNITARYDDINAPAKRDTLDLSHIQVADLGFELQNALLTPDSLLVEVRKFGFREQSGLNVEQFACKVFADRRRVEVGGFSFTTPSATLKSELAVTLPAKGYFPEALKNTGISAHIEGKLKNAGDLAWMSPLIPGLTLPENLRRLHPAFDVSISGRIDSLSVHKAVINPTGHTGIEFSGMVSGLPHTDSLGFLLNLDTLYTTKSDLYALADSAMFGNLALPDTLGMKASGNGNRDSLTATVSLCSSFGNLTAEASYHRPTGNPRDTFNIQLSLTDVKLNEWMKNTALMPVDAVVHVAGAGILSDSLSAGLKTTVSNLYFNGYRYKDLQLEALLHQTNVNGKITLNDPNATFDLGFSGGFPEGKKHLDFDLDLTKVNLYALHFSGEEIAFGTRLKTTFSYTDNENLEAELNFSNTNIYQNGALLPTEEFSVLVRFTADSSFFNFRSDVFNAFVKGNIPSVELEPLLRSATRKYLGLGDTIVLPPDKTLEYTFDFASNKKIGMPFLPGLKKLTIENFSGSYASNNNRLLTSINIPQITYNNIEIDSIDIQIDGVEDTLTFEAAIQRLIYDSLMIRSFRAQSEINNGAVNAKVSIGGSKNTPLFMVAGNMQVRKNSVRMSIFPGGLILDGQKWKVPDDNYLLMENGDVSAEKLDFSLDDRKIVFSLNNRFVKVQLNRFDINNLTGFIWFGDQNKILRGNLNGNLSLPVSDSGQIPSADIQTDEIRLLNVLLGAMHLKADDNNGVLNVDFAVNRENKDKLTMTGNIDRNNRSLNLKALMSLTELSLIEKLTQGEISDMSGSVDGELSLTGRFDKPVLQGDISFDTTHFKLAKLNFSVDLEHEKMTFDNNGLHFDHFTVLDINGEKLLIDGSLLTSDYKTFSADLQINSERFQLVNSTAKDNPHFFGDLFLNTGIKIKGDLEAPEVDADITIEHGTDLTYVLPGSEISIVSPEGTVNFIDPEVKLDTLFKKEKGSYLKDSVLSVFSHLNLSANMSLSPEAKFTLFIDPASGDYLTVAGKADLSILMDEDGNQTVSGVFEVEEGLYQVSFYGLVKKKFTIEPGSTLSWSGGVMDAAVNLRATYIIRTSSTALVANDATSISENEMNIFKKPLPYEVILNIGGFLSDPQVSFNINLPQNDLVNYPLIAGKLERLNAPDMTSELNKQVFALLVTGSFIADNPLTSTNSSSSSIVTTAARNSLNGILTDQLNRISSQYIKYVDISFGLTTYDDFEENSNQLNTELNVQVSKRLFNDRLKVEATGTFDLEGKDKQYTGMTSQHMYGEFAVTYDLRPDGVYKLQVFRENVYDYFDGDVAYSGLAFIFEKSFDRLRKPKKKNKKNQQQENKKATKTGEEKINQKSTQPGLREK